MPVTAACAERIPARGAVSSSILQRPRVRHPKPDAVDQDVRTTTLGCRIGGSSTATPTAYPTTTPRTKHSEPPRLEPPAATVTPPHGGDCRRASLGIREAPSAPPGSANSTVWRIGVDHECGSDDAFVVEAELGEQPVGARLLERTCTPRSGPNRVPGTASTGRHDRVAAPRRCPRRATARCCIDWLNLPQNLCTKSSARPPSYPVPIHPVPRGE